jgi:hypothetical protein
MTPSATPSLLRGTVLRSSEDGGGGIVGVSSRKDRLVSVITVAVCIVAAFVVWLIRWGCNRSAVPDEISLALALLVALLIFAAGPAVLGG